MLVYRAAAFEAADKVVDFHVTQVPWRCGCEEVRDEVDFTLLDVLDKLVELRLSAGARWGRHRCFHVLSVALSLSLS